MKLHHRVNSRQVGDTIVVSYRATPIKVRRPAQGSSVVDVRCGACDGTVQLRVHSVQRTRRARLRWLGLVVLALLVAAAGTYLHFRSDCRDPIALALVALMAWILGLAAAVFWTFRWHLEDGVRIASKSAANAAHELIPFVR
ncbi:hypothetical protein ACFQU9_21045 [Actinomadura namibiensis]|uniref:Uncharacterized protein n=1 Tax=Actinomadura namibiensis TaxID=182080 RepID=A0A7W3LQX1_ACTNM|nr:hypothetical protein [Actinomadura namibiensis]MBA8952592.1 hypothetical protein [Actinomadura namibiensis]